MTPEEAISVSCERVSLSDAEREVLIQARRERGLRIKVIARKMGVTPSAFAKWQDGERRPTVAQLAQWRHVLDSS